MRRMRALSIGHYVAAALPILAAAYGVNHWIGHMHLGASDAQTAAAMKPSQFKADDERGTRKIASAAGDRDGSRVSSHSRARGEEYAAQEDSQESDEASPRSPASDGKPSTQLEGASNDAVASGADCAQIEYRGEGPQLTKITKAEWTAVMDQFHAAKHDLLGWLEKHRHEISDPTAQAMERQVQDLKIQRPPASDEPDLAWRGIGVYGQTTEGEPIVKLGGGFVHLTAVHPARARFEMARLVAQAWAPCELQRVSALDTTWSPLLKCLGVNESQGCGQGTYSESGWAVSTAVAAAVWAPGCQIPAFKAPEVAKCVTHVPFRAIASVTSVSASGASEGSHE